MNSALFPEVVVNGEVVPHALVAAETQNQAAPKGKPGIAWRKAANAVAIRTLLLQQARAQCIVPTPKKVGPGRFETEEEASIRGLLENNISTDPPNPADVRAEWKKDPKRFRTPPLREVSHILCACDPCDEDARAKAEARASAITARVLANPQEFARIAASDSDCGSKSAGGALGQLGPGDTVPEFDAALGALSEGEITAEPVLTRFGYHIIRLDALAEGRVLPFDAVQGRIAEAMEKAAWARAARRFVDELVAGADIKGAELTNV